MRRIAVLVAVVILFPCHASDKFQEAISLPLLLTIFGEVMLHENVFLF